jgi:hypothetical protein
MNDVHTPTQGGFAGDPAEALTVAGTGGCCGNPSAESEPASSPCCGTSAEAAAESTCCGAAPKADAVASGAGCCG